MLLSELRARQTEIETELAALHKDQRGNLRTLTKTEQSRFDELLSEHDGVKADIERHLRLEAIAGGSGGSRAHGDDRGGFQVMRHVDPFGDGADPVRMPAGEARDRALALLDERSGAAPHLSADQRAQAEDLFRRDDDNVAGDYLAKRALVTESEAYRSAWRQVVTDPHPVLTSEEARALRALRDLERAMSIGTDASGGFGVPVFIDPSIIMTAQGSANPFRRIGRVERITTDEWKGVSSAGMTWSYDAEAAAVSDDSPTLAQPTVSVHMARGFIPFSIEVGMDYPNFATECTRLLGEGLDELQAQSMATGSGSGQPYGIITALDANTNVEVVVTTDGAFGGVDINKVWGALPDRFKANATWVMSHDAGNEVATFGNSNNLSFVTVDLTGVVTSLRQRPVEFSSHFPDYTGTTGAANILVVGDFRNYLIAERAGMSVELVPHLFDVTNNRPTGQRGWFAWARHGADSVNDLGFRLLQNQ